MFSVSGVGGGRGVSLHFHLDTHDIVSKTDYGETLKRLERLLKRADSPHIKTHPTMTTIIKMAAVSLLTMIIANLPVLTTTRPTRHKP